MSKYALGLDFGTLNGRVLLVDVDTGEEVGTSVYAYSCGVIDKYLPESEVELGLDWALQNPADYIDVLEHAVPDVLQISGVSPEDVIGIGVDFTSSTILPIDADGVPLCMCDQWKEDPHS